MGLPNEANRNTCTQQARGPCTAICAWVGRTERAERFPVGGCMTIGFTPEVVRPFSFSSRRHAPQLLQSHL